MPSHSTSQRHVVRPGTEADIESCAVLAALAAPERSETDWRCSLLHDVEEVDHHLVVAETGRVIAGYGRARLFEPEPGSSPDAAPAGYYLTGVFVCPDLRRAGIGAALTQARLDWIGERAEHAWFFANARNTASIALHRRFGFEEVTRDFSFPGLRFEGGEGILFHLGLRRRS